MKTQNEISRSYLIPRVLFLTLLSLFIYTVFVILFAFTNAVWYSIAAVCFFSLAFSFGIFSQGEATDSALKKEKTKRSLEITSPLSGRIIPLSSVKDETFAEGIMGEGLAIIPGDDRVYAPVSGMILAFFETYHAITLLSDEGAEVLIHVGKDTVELKGKHFTPLKKAGERVKKGDALLVFDAKAIEKAGYDITTPITVLTTDRYTLSLTQADTVVAGDHLMTLTEN